MFTASVVAKQRVGSVLDTRNSKAKTYDKKQRETELMVAIYQLYF